MSSSNALHIPSVPLGIGMFSCWTLPQRSAVTLDAGQAGYLRVERGAFWATLEGPHHGPANDWGDLVLRSGTRIKLTPGQQVVLEPFGDAANEAASFHWEPEIVVPAPVPVWRRVVRATGKGLRAIGRTLARMVAPDPAWPMDAYRLRDDALNDAWRRLYYLHSNQP